MKNKHFPYKQKSLDNIKFKILIYNKNKLEWNSNQDNKFNKLKNYKDKKN